MTDAPIPIGTDAQWDALTKDKLPLIPFWCRQVSEERLREIVEVMNSGGAIPLRYVTEQELLYGDGKWEDIAANVPLSERGFGT